MYPLIKKLTLLMFFAMSSVLVHGGLLHITDADNDPFDAACSIDCQFVSVKVKVLATGQCLTGKLRYLEGIPQLARCF